MGRLVGAQDRVAAVTQSVHETQCTLEEEARLKDLTSLTLNYGKAATTHKLPAGF